MAKNIFDIFDTTVKNRGDKVAAQYKVAGAWRDITWGEMGAISAKITAGLIKHGVASKDRVTILSKTRVEWCMADFGILGADATTVPIYETSTAEDVQYILDNAGTSFVFAENKDQLEKLREIKSSIPNVRRVVVIDSAGCDFDSAWESSWEDFLAEGEEYKKDHADEIAARSAGLTPDDVLTLIYTSGTTGKPKGTILTHDAMLYEAEVVQKTGLVTPDDVQYLFLPLAHVFAKVLEVAWIQTGHVMAFWEGDQKKIVDNLAEVRPTLMASVPRIYEKVHAAVTGQIINKGGIGGKLGRWALKKGQEAAALEKAGKDPSSFGWNLAQKLVFAKIAETLDQKFGGRLRFFISGGAPLSPDLAFFFKYAGVKICEGYGLTETSAATVVNLPHEIKIGTVGKVLPGTELKIAGDGEILIRGRGVMKGYWKRDEATKEALDDDGWFHTGDIGELDKDGYLRITDRKKDIIVTAGGKNVAPQNIEGALKTKSPLISQVVVHGDKRKYLTAVITVDPDTLKSWAQDNMGANGSFDFAQVSQSDALNNEIEKAVDALNQGLARYETLKKFRILDHDFEIGDQLTPSLKVKRKVVNERYKDVFDSMYE